MPFWLSFVGGLPLKYVDPSGHCTVPIPIIGGTIQFFGDTPCPWDKPKDVCLDNCEEPKPVATLVAMQTQAASTATAQATPPPPTATPQPPMEGYPTPSATPGRIGTPNPKTISARKSGEELSDIAVSLRGEIPDTRHWLRRSTTIAVAQVNGELIATINGSSELWEPKNKDILANIRAKAAQLNVRLIDNDYAGRDDSEGHAERYLYDKYGVKLIGISNNNGMCNECEEYLVPRGVQVTSP
jgi:hypothetical protein